MRNLERPTNDAEFINTELDVIKQEIQDPTFVAKVESNLHHKPTENELVGSWVAANAEKFRKDQKFRNEEIKKFGHH